MSIKLLTKKVPSLIILVLFLSLLSSCIRQILVNFNTTNQVAKKKKELVQLEEKNQALKVRLEEVESREFLDEQARKILGLGDASASPKLAEKKVDFPKPLSEEEEKSNWRKWLELFIPQDL